jgi:hypothetical protein
MAGSDRRVSTAEEGPMASRRLQAAVGGDVRLRSSVDTILVALAEHAPLTRKTIAFPSEQPGAANVIARLEEQLRDPREKPAVVFARVQEWGKFVPYFPQGQSEFPDKNNSTKFSHQPVSSSKEGLKRMDPEIGVDQLIAPQLDSIDPAR